MELSGATMVRILAGAVAAVMSYLAIRRWLFLDQEVREAADWYAKQRGWSVRRSDLALAEAELKRTRVVLTGLALFSWLIFLIVLLDGSR